MFTLQKRTLSKLLVGTTKIKEKLQNLIPVKKSVVFFYLTVCNCIEIAYHNNIICGFTTQLWSHYQTQSAVNKARGTEELTGA